MCGIVGKASIKPVSDRNKLIVARDLLTHRGPDSHGQWWSENGCVGMAHRRLSIIDISEVANQPMISCTGRYVIVFNGEIYNFMELRLELRRRGQTFRSNSDTEVLLGAYSEWGIECPKYLRGMFAFAIYDSEEQCVFLYLRQDCIPLHT